MTDGAVRVPTPTSDLWLGNDHPSLRGSWHPVVASSALGSEPRPVRLLGLDLVVARLGPHGEPAAFVDECPHRLAPLSRGRVVDDCLQCPYHGWRFDAVGGCVLVPSLGPGATLPTRARLEAVAGCVEHQGLVWLALDEPVAEGPPSWEEWGNPSADVRPLSANGGLGLLVDNFFDEAHFPFVHAATIGEVSEPEVIESYEVRRHGLSFTARRQHTFANQEDPAVATGERSLQQQRVMTYRFQAPFFCELRIEMVEAGDWLSIRFTGCPHDADSSTVFTSLCGPTFGDPATAAARVDYETKILLEDLTLQAAMRHRGLPLDPTREVHVRSDRVTIELRRVLADFVNGRPPEPSGGYRDTDTARGVLAEAGDLGRDVERSDPAAAI